MLISFRRKPPRRPTICLVGLGATRLCKQRICLQFPNRLRPPPQATFSQSTHGRLTNYRRPNIFFLPPPQVCGQSFYANLINRKK
ncbi:hypothetical protein C2S52_001753 [Perilla frutescens var. hirtella]|nr:hypothetical protein C2S52_001753 [Perilla frutescens var. hirtella]